MRQKQQNLAKPLSDAIPGTGTERCVCESVSIIGVLLGEPLGIKHLRVGEVLGVAVELIEEDHAVCALRNRVLLDLELFSDVTRDEQHRWVYPQRFFDALFQVFHVPQIFEFNVTSRVVGVNGVQFFLYFGLK